MKSKAKLTAKPKLPRPEVPATEIDDGDVSDDSDDSQQRIVARPDGYHWLSSDGRREFGPFEAFDEALADLQATDEGDVARPGGALLDAERDIGIADWIDPDTGEPAEGQSTPHLQDE